jgi:UDP-glucose 4-epimerase
MKILITGGLGYVGGRISKFLAENTDHFLTITTRNLNLIKKPDWLKNGKIISLDLKDDKSIKNACKNIDTIIHLAALNEIDSLKNPEEAIIINTLGTFKLLKYSKNIDRFIYFSTAHIYGAPLCGNIDETKLPFPSHPYSYTHKFAEDLLLSENKNNIIIRLSNSFGYPERASVNRWTLVVNDLCKQSAVNKKLVLKSDGKQTRDFIPLKDVCSATLHLLNLKKEKLSKLDNPIFNLGGNKTYTILEICKKIQTRSEKILGYKPKLILGENKTNKKISLNYSIEKLLKTGFVLSGNINEEIDKTLLLCKEAFCDDK